MRTKSKHLKAQIKVPRLGATCASMAKSALVLSLILIIVLSSIGSWVPGLASFFANLFPSPVSQVPTTCHLSPDLGSGVQPASCSQTVSQGSSNNPVTVGADPVPSISLPRSVLSHPDPLLSAGGTIRDSPDSLTLYNLQIIVRLLGGSTPHDELIGLDHQVLSSWSFWNIEANTNGSWVPMRPLTNSFSILGTNQTGTYVVRKMQVGAASNVGTLEISYKAASSGELKWTIGFRAATSGAYRLVYTWENLGKNSQLIANEKRMRVDYGLANYTLKWSDVPSSLNTTALMGPKEFTLSINLGQIAANSNVNVDPSIVSSSTYPGATDYQFQRKIFQDSTGRYFAFYFDGFSLGYSSSPDGVSWSAKQSLPASWPSFVDPATSLPSVAYSNGQVLIAAGDYEPSIAQYAYVHYAFGTISGSTINWGLTQSVQAYNCGSCSGFGVRYVFTMLAPNGDFAFSYNAYSGSGAITESVGLVYIRGPSTFTSTIESYSDCGTGPATGVVLPEGNPTNGIVNIIYEYPPSPCSVAQFVVDSVTYSSITQTLGTVISQIGGFSLAPFAFSATSEATYNIDLVYLTASSGQVEYAFHQAGSSSWIDASSVFPSNLSSNGSPTVSVDQSTNTVYVATFLPTGTNLYSVIMNSKSPSQDPMWRDSTYSFQFRSRSIIPQPCSTLSLGSSASPASSTNASSIPLLWTECGGGGTNSVTFGAIPIQTAWSPYSYPNNPWNGKGIEPYGQYFQNLDESVSPGSGTLTVTQTDLSLQGRGLTLVIARTFDGSSFYSPAPIGAGWILGFPWVDLANNLIHLPTGESYSFPANFFGGSCPCAWENHQGEYFKFVINNGIFLYTKSGLVYQFTQTNIGFEPTKITDPTGNNTETFSYNGNYISSITDSVGRLLLFCYNANNYVSTIEQVLSGSCGSEVGLVRRISYSYSGTSPYGLASVTDPAQRVTQFQYCAFGSGGNCNSNYLISQVIYPTGWYSNYTYTSDTSLFGITSYRVSRQITYTSQSSIVRQNAYTYREDQNSGAIDGSTVTSYNGTSIASYTDYAFAFSVVKWNVSDANHNLIKGEIQLFGSHGEVPQEITIVTDGSGHLGTYTNYFKYDLWGDQIYTHSVINPTANWYHDKFTAFYNNGLPVQFSALQETFSSQNGTSYDNPWFNYNGIWQVLNGLPYGVRSGGVYSGQSPVSNPSNPATFFAWANSTNTNLSVIANVYIPTQTISSGERVGVFAHYPGSGLRKWALVLTLNGGTTYLSLLDENVAWVAQSPCSIVNNTWYQFNFTVYGNSAWGSATPAGGSSCNVSGSFSSSDITSATRFGLYSGGLSALFDNVTINLAAPALFGNPGLSNSFYANGAPGTTIHGLMAGTAEQPNGTGTTPIETYYSYYLWGGLNGVKQRYDSPTGTQWIATSRTYDRYGNPATILDPRGNYTYYVFSARYQNAYLTNQTQILKPGGGKITSLYGYNFTTGTTLSSVDPNGFNTTYQYDILGRVTRVNNPSGLGYKSYAYDDQTNYVDITNENGWHTRQIYDGLARLSITEPFLGSTTFNETRYYNWQSQVVRDRDSLGNTYNYTYDALGRPTTTTKPDRNTISYFYNDTGSWTRTTNENGNYRCDVNDRLGRLVSVAENASSNCLSGIVSNYRYNEIGTLAQMINANQKTTAYTYDNLGRLTQESHPDGTTENFVYDNSGNLIKSVDQKQFTDLYSYDSLSRLGVISYCGPPVTSTTISSASYTYDKDGNLLKLQNKNATLTYSYDARSRTLSENYAVNTNTTAINLGCVGTHVPSTNGSSLTYSVSYRYSGEVLANTTYPDNLIVKYVYDGLGRVTTVSKSGGSNYATFSYYNCPCAQRVKGISFGDGTIGNYTYDSLTRPLTIKVQGGSTLLLNLTYAYGHSGTVSSIAGKVNGATINEQYTYDQLNRIIGSTLNDGGTTNTFSYKYDNVGNQLSQTLNGLTTSFTINQANNELTGSQVGAGGATIAYSYDLNGNLATRNVTSGGTVNWKYAWSFSNQLVQVSNNNGVQGTYAYDGTGRRVESVESSTIFYAYRGTQTLYEKIAGGATNDYILAGPFLIAKVSGSTVNYYHSDSLGSTRLVTTSGKHGSITVVFSDNYQPFGQDNGTPTGSEVYKFTAKPVSQATGLYYDYQRWYDPSIGRFISADPSQGQLSNPESLNVYIYVSDRPTSMTDPTGLDACGWNPLSWGSCFNDAVQTANNYIVQPTENYVNTNIVQPALNKVVAPLLNNVVIPIVKNVIIPYATAEYNGLVATYNALTYVGNQLWNGYQTLNTIDRDWTNWFDQSVNQAWQGFAYDVTHLHVTNWTTLLAGIGFCSALVGLAVAAYFLLPEAAAAEAGATVLTLGGVTLFAEGLAGVIAFGTFLAVNCGEGVAGSIAIS